MKKVLTYTAFFILSLSATAMISSCGIFKNKKSKMQILEMEACAPIVKSSEAPEEGGQFKIERLSVSDNCLVVEGQGTYCNLTPSPFEMRWSGKIKKSLPPQITLVLHENKKEVCFETHKFKLKYDLASLDYSEKMMIRVLGHESAVEYNPN